MRQEKPTTDDHESWNSRWYRRAVLGALGAGMGASAAVAAYQSGDQDVVIAGHSAEVAPTFDGYATVQLGVLPDLRREVEMPLNQGIRISLGNSIAPAEAANSKQALEQMTSIYGAVAARPEAEMDVIEAAFRDQAITSGAIGLGISAMPLLLSGFAGHRRRRELGEKLGKADDKYHLLVIGGAAVSLVAMVGVSTTEFSPEASTEAPFVPLVQKVPSAATVPELSGVKIRDIDLATFGSDIVEGGVKSLAQSIEFYDRVNQSLETVASDIRTPKDDEELTLVYSDRHSNIGGDSVIRNLIGLSEATRAIGVGDETSTGAAWEEFSTRSISKALEGVEKAAILGNHDITPQGFVREELANGGFMLANGGVQQFGESSILLVDDERSSGLTTERIGGKTDEEVAEEVADVACDYGRVNILVTAKDDYAVQALEESCVDLAINADTHIQTGPEPVTGDNGDLGYTITNGTSGGAAYALALGKFRRDASYTLLTTRHGVPVGIQIVRVRTDGIASVDEYRDIFPSSLTEEGFEGSELKESSQGAITGTATITPK